ncbi:MAG: penicillin-binding protein activator [Gammaproteobacteria bacterium]
MPKNIFIRFSVIAVAALILTSCAETSRNESPLPLTSSVSSVSRAQITEDAFWEGSPHTLWDRLQHVSLKNLEIAAAQSDPTRAAWIKLAIINKRYSVNTSELVQQITAWRNENPKHPANSLFPNNGTLNALKTDSSPTHIAVLLPLEGSNAANGHAVRDGFLSAYYASLGKTHGKQTISFYDTSQNPAISALYQQAQTAGATLIVGPLLKDDVQALLKSSDFKVPTLALNYTDDEGALPANVYEFGLSQVDEAQQIAEKAWQKGLSHALLIAPQNAWGQRVSKTLISRWESLGGSMVDTFSYSAHMDFNPAIANLLHVNPQNDNKKKKETNKTVLEQQRRQDFDVIFLLADPNSAREIVPLLKYYYVENIPIYATSSIYSGAPNPQKDTDLNGVKFADIPWVFKGSNNSNRLYAVGRDAYTISNQLSRLIELPNSPLYAATGALTLTADHKIYRRLPMATMHNGHP